MTVPCLSKEMGSLEPYWPFEGMEERQTHPEVSKHRSLWAAGRQLSPVWTCPCRWASPSPERLLQHVAKQITLHLSKSEVKGRGSSPGQASRQVPPRARQAAWALPFRALGLGLPVKRHVRHTCSMCHFAVTAGQCLSPDVTENTLSPTENAHLHYVSNCDSGERCQPFIGGRGDGA